jgi:hypothetical protein
MLYLQDAEGVRFKNLEANAVVAHTESKIPRALQAFDVANACVSVVGE